MIDNLPDCVAETDRLRDERLDELGSSGYGPPVKYCWGHDDYCVADLQDDCIDCEKSYCRSTMKKCRGCDEWLCEECWNKDFECKECAKLRRQAGPITS